MRVLVTGATGLVGTRLVERLMGAGHETVVLSRDAARARQHLPGTHVHGWDPLAGPPTAEALADLDAVVHLAGEPVVGRWTAAKRRAIEDSRVVGTRNLVAGLRALDRRPSVLVSASAMGYYGSRGDTLLPEDAGPGEDFLARVCVGWESAAESARELGIQVVCPRIGLVLHPDGGALQAMLRPFRMGLGGPLGDGRQWWSWIHREDLVSLLLHAITEDTLDGPVNAVTAEPVRQAEFAKTLGRTLGRWAFLPGPRMALELVLGEFSTELLSSRRLVPQAAQEAGFAFQSPDLQTALNDLLALH